MEGEGMKLPKWKTEFEAMITERGRYVVQRFRNGWSVSLMPTAIGTETNIKSFGFFKTQTEARNRCLRHLRNGR